MNAQILTPRLRLMTLRFLVYGGIVFPMGLMAQDRASSGVEIYDLPVFEVNSTQGKGYRTTNAVTGTKSATPLLEIPASVAIVTRDFIDDMASRQTIGDILKFAVAGAPPAIRVAFSRRETREHPAFTSPFA
jgi:iron complex outermembrane receptor protein